uniref:ORF6 n=1 Tax=Nitrosopumilaceae spindle-shaped virus TaxID=3065433 RepID=A0AAT9J9J6_9VIRU
MSYLKNKNNYYEDINEIKLKSKCISDRILNYIQFGINRIEKHTNIVFEEDDIKWFDESYGKIRIEQAEKGLISNKHGYTSNPILFAPALIYILCCKKGYSITQQDLVDIYFKEYTVSSKRWYRRRKGKHATSAFRIYVKILKLFLEGEEHDN